MPATAPRDRDEARALPQEVPLRHNRDFVLLQTGQLLSSAGSQSTAIAYPLLVLAFTHSASKAGIVGFADFLPAVLFGLFVGVAADRWNRKRMMIVADVAQAATISVLVAAIFSGHLSLWLVASVAFVEGTASSFFSIASTGAMRAVVPPRQMPTAAGAMQARLAIVRLAGPPLGGALFGIARALPFIADVVSYVFSVGTVAAMHTPFQEQRKPDATRIRTQIAEGFRFLWERPFLRTVALIFSGSNFVFTGVALAVIVIGKRQGLASGEIGALVATFGAVSVAGALLSGVIRRRLSMRAILLAELWASAGLVAFVAWPSVYVLVACLLPQMLVIPVTDTVLAAYRFAVTPDRLIGRVASVSRNIGIILTPFGALVAGLLLGTFSARVAIAVFASISVVLAVWGTFSPSIRTAPSLDSLIEGDSFPEAV